MPNRRRQEQPYNARKGHSNFGVIYSYHLQLDSQQKNYSSQGNYLQLD